LLSPPPKCGLANNPFTGFPPTFYSEYAMNAAIIASRSVVGLETLPSNRTANRAAADRGRVLRRFLMALMRALAAVPA
jgi:hypothetical protein